MIVPGLIFVTRMPMIAAIGFYLISVGTFALMTAISYSLSGLVTGGSCSNLLEGEFVGGTVGVWLAARLSKQQRALHYVFSGVVMLVTFYMLIINAEALDW